MQCKVKCFKCDLDQTYLINHAAYHGACDNESITQGSFEMCVHCNSIVFCCIVKNTPHEVDLRLIENKTAAYINCSTHFLPQISLNQRRSKTVKAASVLKKLKITQKYGSDSIKQSSLIEIQNTDSQDKQYANEYDEINHDEMIQKFTKIDERKTDFESNSFRDFKTKEINHQPKTELEKLINNPFENLENVSSGCSEELDNHQRPESTALNFEKKERLESNNIYQLIQTSSSEMKDNIDCKNNSAKKIFCSRRYLVIYIAMLCVLIVTATIIITIYFNT